MPDRRAQRQGYVPTHTSMLTRHSFDGAGNWVYSEPPVGIGFIKNFLGPRAGSIAIAKGWEG
jgi:hypothetical protein